MKFIPGGRYIYYGGRKAHFFNNCFCLRAEEDTREEWGALAQRATNCLMVGGGIGVYYSRIRPKGRTITRTGGVASGSLSLMEMINEIGRNVMQGGSRRSAIYASLNWQHGDANDLLTIKDWDNTLIGGTQFSIGDMKKKDYNYRAPLDMTNISLNYDDDFLLCTELPDTFIANCAAAMRTGEPGFSFNFERHSEETLRNA
jgi:ribonucleoside-diphosphate reductase alpha chain